MDLSKNLSRNQAFDKNFKVSGVHKFIFNFAKERGGVFDCEAYREHLKKSDIDPKMQKRILNWNDTTLSKLKAAGYITSVGTGKYQLVDVATLWVERPRPGPEFKIGKNHVRLLEKHQDGIVKSADLKHEHKGKSQREYARQAKFIDGMVLSLINNGYLTREQKGVYKLTEGSYNAIAQARVETETLKAKHNIQNKDKSLKITDFDSHLLAVADEHGNIRSDYIGAHERGESINKRIFTLTNAGLIKDGKVTPELEKRINMALYIKRHKTLSPELLTKEQRQVMDDMRIFMNLSPSQLIKHVYKGNVDKYNTDISLLLQQGVLEKNAEFNVFILGKNGSKLLRQIDPERSIHKLRSKPQEVGHDALVYTAFKVTEKEIKKSGGEVILIQNDRMLKSADMKQFGCMKGRGEYPDLRIKYTDKYGTERVHDLEIDCGYDAKTINAKVSAFFNSSGFKSFSYCCKTLRQASKVASIINTDKTRSLKKHKTLKLSYIDEKGNVRVVNWK